MPLYISSIASGFSVEGQFDGTYQVHPDFIELNFKAAEIRLAGSPADQHSKRVTAVKIGLAHRAHGEGWDTLNNIEIAAPKQVLQVGQSIRFTPAPVRIPIGASLDLSDRWFVVEIQIVDAKLPNVSSNVRACFAHSDRDIFATAR